VPGSKKQSASVNSSKVGVNFGLGTSTNINKSAVGLLGGNATLNQFNSNIDASGADIDMEFGYCTEEDSIFHSFQQEVERTIPRINKQVKTSSVPKSA